MRAIRAAESARRWGPVQSIFTNGITGSVNGATTSVKAFSEIVSGLAGSGGVGGTLGSIVQGFSGMAGSITSSLGSIVSFIMSEPRPCPDPGRGRGRWRYRPCHVDEQ